MKNQKQTENHLSKTPIKSPDIKWTADENGVVTLEIENKGIFNKIAQKLFRKPKISYIHLDEMGSFIWLNIDGKNDITAIGALVKAHFGEKAQPLYERLSKYIQILVSYGFVKLS